MQFRFSTSLFVLSAFIALTAAGTRKTEACVTALPSPFAVKDQDGNLLVPDEGSGNTYTIPEGTKLTFEVAAEITDLDFSNLASEWYNSDNLNEGNPIATLAWWWWTSTGKNPAVDETLPIPEQLNTPNAPANTRRNGLFAIEQTFDEATPEDTPISISAAFYGEYVGDQNTPALCPASVVTFFVHVIGPPDVTPPELTVEPVNTLIEAGIGDRISVNLNAIDYNNDSEPTDDLLAIEWYVEPFGLPVRSHGANTLNIFLGSSNDDGLQYRFGTTGTFEITAVAYDNFLNVSEFTWNVDIQEPLITRAAPDSAEISVTSGNSKTFEVLADPEIDTIAGVCWQNDQGAPFYASLSDAALRGNFTVFEWNTDFDFGTITDFFETAEVTATAYSEDGSGVKTLIGNTVTWVVRGERHADNSKDFTFCGLDWKVKQSNPLTLAIGPGKNYFYGSNVSLDTEGLHLQLTQDGDRWTSAEVFTVNSMPRGIYRFYLEGDSGTRLDQLDTQVVFSPFFYADNTREIDIEFSNWPAGSPYGAGQFQYIVQPVGDDSIQRYGLDLENPGDPAGKITCQIDWQDDRVIFSSWLGHSAVPPEQESILLETWMYTSDGISSDNFIPEPGDELKLHLNLYLKDNRILDQDNEPDNDLPAHVIVKAIDHPASWEGWRVENFGERNVFAPSEISNPLDDPDFDNCPNLLEYALGSSPWAFAPDRQLALEIYENPDDQKKYVDFTLTRRQATQHPLSDSLNGIYHTPFLDYSIKSKADLNDAMWTDEPLNSIANPIDLSDGTERVTYRTENSIEDVPRKFFQLQVNERNSQ